MPFSERLQLLVDRKKITQAALASGAGVNRSRVSEWLSGKNENPRRSTIIKLADFFECDINWLAEGKGEPFPDRDTPPAGNAINLNSGKKVPLSNMVSITYIEDTYASAGKGIINYDAAREVMHFDRNFLTSQIGSTNFENVHIIHAVGDSMMSSIAPGDMLFVNPGDRDVVTGAVYVFVIGEETLVKRAERNPLSGELILRSDNEQYAPIDIHHEDIEKVNVIGRVIGNFKKF